MTSFQSIILVILVIALLNFIKPLSTHIVQINTSNQLWFWLCSHNIPLQNNLTLHLTQSNYILHNMTFCLIENVSNVTLKGVGSDGKSSIKCQLQHESTTGFGFVNISSVTLENLEFTGCGATITKSAVTFFNDTHPHLGYKQKALLVFNHCHNITIQDVNITNYIGYAIFMLNPLNSSLMNNVRVTAGTGANYCNDSDMFACAGSGIFVMFKDTQQTSPDMAPVNVILSMSNISSSFNIIPNVPPLTLIGHDICSLPVVGAGGLTVLFNQSFLVRFSSQSTQIGLGAGNGGTVAGNMLVIFYNGMVNSQLSLTNTNILNGILLPLTNQIGGACLTIISTLCQTCSFNGTKGLSVWTPISLNNVQIVACNYGTGPGREFNHVKYGGGFYLNIFEFCRARSIVLLLKRVQFRKNYVYKSGSCLYAFVTNSVLRDKNISIIIEDVEIKSNRQGPARYTLYSTVAGLTLINWNNVTFRGNSKFTENNSPVIAAYKSNIHMTGQLLFRKNTGTMGAAIQLFSSFLILHEPLNATFLDNSALLYGGAIYADNVVIPGHHRCVIQINTNKIDLQNIDIILKFKGNIAGLAGGNIYATPLYNCSFLYPQHDKFELVHFDWKSIAHFDTPNSLNNGLEPMSSQPVKICSCHLNNNTNKVVKNCSQLYYIPTIIHTYAGKTVTMSLCAVDDSGAIVYSPAVLFTTTYKRDKLLGNVLYLKQGQTLVPLSGTNCTQIHYNVLSKLNEFKRGRLNIATPGSPPSWSAELYVHPCPMGFMLKGDECVCDSFIVDMSPSTKCNITTTTISIYSGQWLGHISSDNKNKLGFASVCPPGNCKTDTLLFNVTDPFSICESSKMGILCSQCQHNMSIVFGSTECRPCSDLWLITIVGYALSGLLLVTIMLALPLTISEGPLAGIIIAVNITSVSTIDYLDSNNWFVYTARIFVSLMNLNLGFPMCLYNGMTPTVKTAIQFVYPAYLWVLVIGFIIFSHYSTRISNRTASYSVQVLASLIHLSFSKVLITCIDIIAYVPVHTSQEGTVVVWYGDGNVEYLSSPQHIVLFTVAVISLLLYIVPYILFVTFGRYCIRWRCVNKYLRPFLEAFQGPYKQGQGYWYGVRMIVVVYVYLMWAVFRGCNFNLMLFMQLTPVIILSMIQLSLKPFRSFRLSHVDISCLILSICQLQSALVFGGRYYWLSFMMASFNYIILILMLVVMGCQCWQKLKYKLRRERSHGHGQVVIPVDENDDEMRQALLLLND